MIQKPFIASLIIPTGVGAAIGGYAGDGSTLLPLFASVCDAVITHPNVANAACFQNLPSNVFYVEGFALDQFFRDQIALYPVHQNKVGVIIDSGIEEGMKMLHLNTIDAVKTTYGVNVVEIIETKVPMELVLEQTETGRSTGVVNNLEVLFEACEKLIAYGANAIAVCCQMPECPEEENQDYISGSGVDPIGGIEAMISHSVVARYNIPSAHAPVFNWEEAEPIKDKRVDAKSAAEFIVPTFLPCVLQGLSKAPQYQSKSTSSINYSEVSVLIVPHNALGSTPVLAALENNIPVIAVLQNTTVMHADNSVLGLQKSGKVTVCNNYLEALALCVALKQGVTLPEHIFSQSSSQKQFATAS